MPDASWTTSTSSGLPYRIRLRAGWEYQAPTGGALWLSFLCIGLFAAVAGLGVFGTGRQPPDGQTTAIMDLRLAFFTRFSIQVFFLTALVAMGVATELPVLLIVSVALIAADVGIARLVDERRTRAGLAPAQVRPFAAVAAVAARARQR